MPAEHAMAPPVLEIHDLHFAWPGQAELLHIPLLSLNQGERVFLEGPSGSGKSTLLGLVGGVHMPDRGHVRLLGRDLASLGAAARDRWRVDHTGFIFQQFNLLPFLSVSANVTLPCGFSRLRRSVPAVDTAVLSRPQAGCSSTLGCPRRCSSAAPTRSPSASSNGSPRLVR